MQKHKQLKLDATQASKLDWVSLPYDFIIGVDEVGRGCLAGPVVAGSVLFSRVLFPEKHTDQINSSSSREPINYQWSEFKDSKTLSESKRSCLSQKIKENFLYSLGTASEQEIDQINILNASLLAMKRSILQLNLPTSSKKIVLVDGNQFIKNLEGYDQIAVVKGDQWIPLISSASIIAKVHRDNFMNELESVHPGFGFNEHKGYATQGHRDAIAKLGVTSIHRKSFKGVKEYVL